eukprot:Rmarinus@m.1741
MKDIVKVAIENRIQRDEIYEEASQHINFAKTRARSCFVTPEIQNIIDHLREFLDSRGDRRPFVVHGRSGAGKTSIMAKLTFVVKDFFGASGCNMIVRFLGTTRMSGTSRALMVALCEHIMRIYPGPIDPAIPSEYLELKALFRKLLSRVASTGTPLVIVLDSLDQLTDDDNGRGLDWLPCDGIPGVLFVVSTLPEEGKCLDVLKSQCKESDMLEVQPLQPDDARRIVDGWLKEEKRALAPSQLGGLLKSFREIGSPLYLRIAFEQALSWRSYMAPPPLASNVHGLVVDMFESL